MLMKMAEDIVISEKDATLRERWLLLNILQILIYLIFPPESLMFDWVFPGERNLAQLFFLHIAAVVWNAIFYLSLWYCAYKERGTALLSCNIALFPFQIAGLIVALIQMPEGLPSITWTLYLGSIALLLCQFLLSLRLRKINKILRSDAHQV
ncbi:MAG TPA: hypothetical protein VIJ14_03875 [Rhabdochlamydiaceae bacterium]